jgi:hypothetical protein
MNAIQKAKLTMYQGIEKLCSDNPAIIATVAAFVTALTAFKAIIAAIGDMAQLKDTNLSGIAEDKTTLKQMLAQLAAYIAGLIYAYASATANNTLKEEVNFNYSQLLKTRDAELPLRCQIIHDKAVENIDALADYGITSARLTELQTAIDEYEAAAPKPRAAIGSRKTYKANLVELFKQGDKILNEQMDKIVPAFRSSHPDFYNTYINLRDIPDPSTTTTQLKGVVTSLSGGTAVKDAIVTVVELGKTAKTNSSGTYHFKPIPNGTYTVLVTAEGFNNFEVDGITVKLGQINHLDVELVSS